MMNERASALIRPDFGHVTMAASRGTNDDT